MNIFMYKLYIIHMGSSKTADTWNITSSFLRPTAPVTRQSKETYCNTLGVLWRPCRGRVGGRLRGASHYCGCTPPPHTSDTSPISRLPPPAPVTSQQPGQPFTQCFRNEWDLMTSTCDREWFFHFIFLSHLKVGHKWAIDAIHLATYI